MATTEIIAEIDAYLSRLRQARELLINGIAESPKNRLPPRKEKATNRQAGARSSNSRRTGENKSRSNYSVTHLKSVMKRVDSGAHVPSTPALGAVDKLTSSSEQPVIVQPERPMGQSVVVTRVPARRISSIRSARHRAAKPESDAKPASVKPAIALASAVGPKIVVVSAEQIRREQTAQSEVRRPRTLTSGLSGRRAFDALFQD